jgi:hypothetical protein
VISSPHFCRKCNVVKGKDIDRLSIGSQLSPRDYTNSNQDQKRKPIMTGQCLPANDGEDIVQLQITAATSSMLLVTSAPVNRSAWHDLIDYSAHLDLTGPTTMRHVFSFLAKKYKDKVWVSAGTLWTRYSMLRKMLIIRGGNVADDGSIMACESWL